MAHNGSDYNFIKSIIDYIALDFKGIKKETVERITKIKKPKMQRKEIIELCKRNNVLVDVRTVFIKLFFYFQKKICNEYFF